MSQKCISGKLRYNIQFVDLRLAEPNSGTEYLCRLISLLDVFPNTLLTRRVGEYLEVAPSLYM